MNLKNKISSKGIIKINKLTLKDYKNVIKKNNEKEY